MANRIKELRARKRLSLERLADLVGTSRQQIHKLETGKVRLTVDWMMRLAPPLGVDARDLMSPESGIGGGSPPLQIDRPHRNNAALFRESPVHSVTPSLPILGSARGNRQGVFHMPVEQDPIGFTPRPTQLEGVRLAYGLYVYDDSMAEKYCHGQILWVHPEMPCRPGDGVVIVKNNDEALIKILVRRTGRAMMFRQINPPEEFEIPTDAIRHIHRIIGAIDPV